VIQSPAGRDAERIGGTKIPGRNKSWCAGGSYKINMVKFYKERDRTLWKNGFISQRKNRKNAGRQLMCLW
jgi:hypothetical protein